MERVSWRAKARTRPATSEPARNTVAVAVIDDNLDVEIEVIAAAD